MDPQKFEAKLKALGVKRKRARKNKYAVYMPMPTREIIWKPVSCRGRGDPNLCGMPHMHQFGVNQRKWFSRCHACRRSYGNLARYNGEPL